MRKHPIKIAMGKTIRFMSKPWLVDLPCHLALDLTRNYVNRPASPHARSVCAPIKKAVTTAFNRSGIVIAAATLSPFLPGTLPESSVKARDLLLMNGPSHLLGDKLGTQYR